MSENQKDINKEGYRTAFKSTSIYGGVQVITIIIGILKSKLTAVWLGPSGFGVLGVLNSTIALISSLSNLGLSSSAVRDISKVSAAEDNIQLSIVVKAISRCVFFTGIFGALIMFGLSKYLSIWTFGNEAYTVSYALLAIVILTTNIYSAQYAILQGLRRIKDMAIARILGSISGLIIIIPCYYLGGLKGIVPSLILSSLLALIISYFFTRKVSLINVKQTIRESWSVGQFTIKLGVVLMFTGLMGNLIEVIVKSYITISAGLDEVGLYQAGWAINTQYLGLVFTAMATDYYPRLSQSFVTKKISSVNEIVNQQSEIALLVLSPLICGMLIFLPIFIKLVYSSDFLGASQITAFLLIGSLVKAGSWAVSFVFLAAGDAKTYFINEIIISLLMLVLFIAGYKMVGLAGVGIAFVISYVIYFVGVSYVAFKKYSFSFDYLFWKVLIVSIALCLACYCITTFIANLTISYVLSLILFLISILYSARELERRIGIISIIKSRINGRK